MKDFEIKPLLVSDIELELAKIGFDIAYRAKAANKFRYKTLKIFDLTLPQANILKQTALSLGADCGVHRDILTANVNKTDVILGGSYSQLKKISEKLQAQPFSMKFLADCILKQLESQKRETKLVGILNVTPDSFSDGGEFFTPKKAIEHLYQLVEDGADVIDIGAESTKPYSIEVSPNEQIRRLEPILREISNLDIPISIDTRSSEVAHFALDYGVQIINDTSGLDYDTEIADVVSKYNATIILQHSTKNAGDRPIYGDVIEDVYFSLKQKTVLAKEKGIKNIIIDPGIGFGKGCKENFEILNRIEEFYTLNFPVMVGISRKSFICSSEMDNSEKDALTLALSYPLIQQKIDYLRVHNVKLHKQLLKSVT